MFLIDHHLTRAFSSVVVVLRTQCGTEGRSHNEFFFICQKTYMHADECKCMQDFFVFVFVYKESLNLSVICAFKSLRVKNREVTSNSKQNLHSFNNPNTIVMITKQEIGIQSYPRPSSTFLTSFK